jgi:hypothetical protein
MQRPAAKNALWRIRPAAPTPAKWKISKLSFFQDVICEIHAPGAVVASEWVRVKGDIHKYNAKNVIDDDPETVWIPDCVPYEGEWTGCQASPDPNIDNFAAPAWIGFDYGDVSQTVRCVQMWQSDAFMEDFDRPTFTEAIDIQRWNVDKWLTYRTVTGLGAGYLIRTLPWRDHLWALNTEENMPNGWNVAEMRFHKNHRCQDGPLPGEAISSQP